MITERLNIVPAAAVALRASLLVLSAAGCASMSASTTTSAPSTSPVARAESARVPKNIILMIGDGMGLSQITSAYYGTSALHLQRFFHAGMLTTHSTVRITDSAAGATALSTGEITRNGMLAMFPDSTAARMVTQVAGSAGKRTGIVSTSRVTHATPAAFVVHHPTRAEEDSIAGKFPDGPADVILGAGWNYFLPTSAGGMRADGRNVVAEMQALGHVYMDSLAHLPTVADHERVLGLFAARDFGPAPARGDVLSRLTAAALANLSRDPEGFFLMVEGSQIDWAGHANQGDRMVHETIDFDHAIGVALDFAERDGETLVIVTADHETGGYGLVRDTTSNATHAHGFLTDYHTATAIPLFAYGPHAERFAGLYHITRVGRLLLELLGEPHSAGAGRMDRGRLPDP